MKQNLIDTLYDMFLFSYNRMEKIFTNECGKMKTNQEIAKEVFQGKWGNNAERRKRLIEAGYDYDAIQSIVNAIAKEMPLDKIIEAAEEYDRKNGTIGIEITGTEIMEIEVDLTKYKGINLTFIAGDANV